MPVPHGTLYGSGVVNRHSKYSSSSVCLTVSPIAAYIQLRATLPYFNTSSQHILWQFVSA